MHAHWNIEDLEKTPSRVDGIPESQERAERFAACESTRNLLRQLFLNDTQAAVDRLSRVQVVACYYLQLFYMHRSLRQEDTQVVVLAAAFLASKVVDAPRRMRDLLRTYNVLLSTAGQPELGESEQERIKKRILKVEFVMMRIIGFDFDPVLPLDEVEQLADRLLTQLTLSVAFKQACASGQPVLEANALKSKVVPVAVKFVNDAFAGMGPLLTTSREVAAGALAVAVRYARREMAFEELCAMLASVGEAGDRTCLTREQVKLAINEILYVFRMHRDASAAKAALVKPEEDSAPAKADSAGGHALVDKASCLPVPKSDPVVGPDPVVVLAVGSNSSGSTSSGSASAIALVSGAPSGQGTGAKVASSRCSRSPVDDRPRAAIRSHPYALS